MTLEADTVNGLALPCLASNIHRTAPDADEVGAMAHGGLVIDFSPGSPGFEHGRTSGLYAGAGFTFSTAVLSCDVHDSFITYVVYTFIAHAFKKTESRTTDVRQRLIWLHKQ